MASRMKRRDQYRFEPSLGFVTRRKEKSPFVVLGTLLKYDHLGKVVQTY